MQGSSNGGHDRHGIQPAAADIPARSQALCSMSHRFHCDARVVGGLGFELDFLGQERVVVTVYAGTLG
jgi:hypothetical protein